MSIKDARIQLAGVCEKERAARLPVDAKLAERDLFEGLWLKEYGALRDAWSPHFQLKEQLENYIKFHEQNGNP